MPQRKTIAKAKADLRAGKRPSTAAGEFVHDEIERVRHGEHGVRSAKQAIAIGLSEARRAGVPLKPPTKGKTSGRTRRAAQRDYEVGQGTRKARAPSRKRARATEVALKREPRSTVSKAALSRQAKRSHARQTSVGLHH